MTRNKDFEDLIENLSFTYKQFCLNKFAHKKVNTKYYHDFKDIWDKMLISLEVGYLMGLAKFFDPQNKKFKPRLSLSYFLNPETGFDKNSKRTIKKIKEFRHNVGAHLDLKSARDLTLFMKKLNLRRKEIPPLFKKVIAVVEKTSRKHELTDLKLRFKKEKLLIEKQFRNFVPDKYRRPKGAR